MAANVIPERLLRVQQHLSEVPATSPNKLCTAKEAVDVVRQYDRITVSGFVGTGCPEEVLNALGARYRSTGQPKGLKLFTTIVVGNGKGRGMDVLAEEGLLSEMVYAWAGITPLLTKLIRGNKIRAWNLPFGCVTQMLRDGAAGREGPLTTIGTGTFVDPAEKVCPSFTSVSEVPHPDVFQEVSKDALSVYGRSLRSIIEIG